MTMLFYRAVSHAEFSDFRRSGRLRAVPSSCEGKHLACELAHARRWGERLCEPEGFRILQVSVPDAVAAGFFRRNHLDGIGPAVFATIERDR